MCLGADPAKKEVRSEAEFDYARGSSSANSLAFQQPPTPGASIQSHIDGRDRAYPWNGFRGRNRGSSRILASAEVQKVKETVCKGAGSVLFFREQTVNLSLLRF